MLFNACVRLRQSIQARGYMSKLPRACVGEKVFVHAQSVQNFACALPRDSLCACGNDIYFAPAPIVFLSRLRSVACLSHADGIEIYCASAKLIISWRACTEIFSPARAANVILSHAHTQITRSRKCDNVVFIAPIRAQQKIRAPGNEILRTYRRNYVKITNLKRHSSSGKARISVRELSVRSQEVRK